jgi:hypothetical protein
MRLIFIGVLSIFISASSIAQTTSNACSLFKKLKFKNGRDTIVVKAILYGNVQAPPKLLNVLPSIYKYKFDGYVEFQPENCLQKYNEPILNSAAVKTQFLNGNNTGLTVYVTCVVFNEHFLHTNGDPDCLVIKITPAIHSPIAITKRCNFLSHLDFKNGVDTIFVKANYHAVFKPGLGLILNDLDKKNLLKAKGYEYGIGFQISGCDEKIIAPYRFKNTEELTALEKEPEGTSITMTCVVFEKYYNYGMPFFVIERVETPAK